MTGDLLGGEGGLYMGLYGNHCVSIKTSISCNHAVECTDSVAPDQYVCAVLTSDCTDAHADLELHSVHIWHVTIAACSRLRVN